MNSEVLGPQRSLLKDTLKFLGSHLNRKCTNPTFCQIQKILTKVANLRLPKYKLDIGVIAMQGRDRILIIEDDPAVGESLRDSLTSNGFHAEWKASGGEGIRHAQSELQDLVILDGRLPDGSGFDFFRQIRQMRLRQPILMLTARREEADKILGLEIGAEAMSAEEVRFLTSRPPSFVFLSIQPRTRGRWSAEGRFWTPYKATTPTLRAKEPSTSTSDASERRSSLIPAGRPSS
ncbi:MAG TPA: response regulator transcription factor [Dehalococcoidia bacterium]|nr:response regulator transcription factor [Dehalococcoidia bacterium]